MLRLPVSSSEALTLAQMALTQRKHSAAFVNTDAAASQLALAVLLFALPAAEEPIARERGVKSLVVRLLCVHVITTKAGGGALLHPWWFFWMLLQLIVSHPSPRGSLQRNLVSRASSVNSFFFFFYLFLIFL